MSQLDPKELLAKIAAAATADQLEELRVKYLGRSGLVTAQLRQLSELPPAERKAAGARANQLRGQVEEALAVARQKLQHQSWEQEAQQITVDVTAPVASTPGYGHTNPISEVIDHLVRVYWQMGYTVVDGPEVDTEWYNFDALLVHPDHPARDMQDTFYLEHGNLPRTHTSNMQIRHMEAHQPPIRIISIGKVYRNEDEDARHTWMFRQIEGLVVDKGITLADLKGTLLAMMRGILGEGTEVRLRPNYFPYVEPGVEMDASCPACHGKGGDCKTCSGTGWLEMGGAGMVHPQVLRNVGIDPEVYSGFAFGFGAERISMIKHGVGDLRQYWRPDLSFLEQF
jgi:phenylalanyl-tRNA synthetase alpha chain